jgi:hypothetical protein
LGKTRVKRFVGIPKVETKVEKKDKHPCGIIGFKGLFSSICSGGCCSARGRCRYTELWRFFETGLKPKLLTKDFGSGPPKQIFHPRGTLAKPFF